MQSIYLTIIFLLGTVGCCFAESGIADLVHNRYYCIQRIQKAVSFLIKSVEKADQSWISLISQQMIIASFLNPVVHTMVQSLISKGDISPIVDLWDLFSSYHYIEDIVFLDETIRAVALIAVVLTVEITHQKTIKIGENTVKVQDFLVNNFSTDQLCALIKVCCLKMQYKNALDEYSFNQKKPELDPSMILIHIDTIAERFYYVHRYEKAILLLHSLYENVAYLKDFDCMMIVDEITDFSYQHPFIISCVKKMQETHNLEPLFFLCNQLKEYEFIGEDQFITDFTHLVFASYYTIYSYFVIKKPLLTNEQQSVMEKISLVYEKIDQLPIEEILSVIDILVHDLPILMDQCQMNSSLSWAGWFKNYWWAPALMGINLFFKIAKKIFGKPQPSSYQSSDQSTSVFFTLE